MNTSFETLVQYGALGAIVIVGIVFAYFVMKFFINQIREHDKEQKQTIGNLIETLKLSQATFEETVLKLSLEQQKISSSVRDLCVEIKEIRNELRRKD